MIEFILNDRQVRSESSAGTTLLDIIRYEQHLPGTKIGCREGDCGACTVLVGELRNDRLEYRSMTSCLLALANVHGKHIVTVEGLSDDLPHGAGVDRLSPVQQAMVDHGATQCGFCTPGFVVSLSGCCLSHEPVTQACAIRSIDGNICRCTGYKSIERAAEAVAEGLTGKTSRIPWRGPSVLDFYPRISKGSRNGFNAYCPAPPTARTWRPQHPWAAAPTSTCSSTTVCTRHRSGPCSTTRR